jgi:hypothetical protein
MLCVLAPGDLLLLVGSLGFGDRCGLNKCSDCINVGGNGDVWGILSQEETRPSTVLLSCEAKTSAVRNRNMNARKIL